MSQAVTPVRADRTRFLLATGAIVGPLYLSLGVGQGLLREGFDFGRHPLSVLANGTGGWIQTANFALTGAMVVAAAIGLRRALTPEGRWLSRLLIGYGACILAAALFPADPVDGFPIGTPAGFPTSISTVGVLHFAFGALGFTLLGMACLVAARSGPLRKLAMLSLASGVLVLGGFYGGMMVPGVGIAGIWLTVVVGWTWLAIVSVTVRAAVATSPSLAP